MSDKVQGRRWTSQGSDSPSIETNKPGHDAARHVIGTRWLASFERYLDSALSPGVGEAHGKLFQLCRDSRNRLARLWGVLIWFLHNAPAEHRPSVRRISLDQTAGVAESRIDILARIDAKFDSLCAQQDDPGYLLFSRILALSGSRRMIGRVLREASSSPRCESRATSTPMASDGRKSPGERASLVESNSGAEATDIAVNGPHWIEEMFQLEGIDSVERRHRAGTVIFCLTKDKGPEVARVVLDSARSRGARTIAWFLDDIAVGASNNVISQFDHVYAARAHVGDALRTMTRKPVRILPPAVQPKIHNPIGRSNRPNSPTETIGIREVNIPVDWATMFDHASGVGPEFGSRVHPNENRAKDEFSAAAARLSLVRQTLTGNSLRSRLEHLEHECGIRLPSRLRPKVSLIVPTNRPAKLECVLESVSRQVYPETEIVLVLNKASFNEGQISAAVDKRGLQAKILRAPDDWTLGECLQYGSEICEGRIISKMDDDDFYGANYVSDMVLSIECSEAAVVAKSRRFIYFENEQELFLRDGLEWEYSTEIMAGGTITFKREVLELLSWRPKSIHEDFAFFRDCLVNTIPVLAADRFNYAYVRGDQEKHTSTIRRGDLKRYSTQVGGIRDVGAVEV